MSDTNENISGAAITAPNLQPPPTGERIPLRISILLAYVGALVLIFGPPLVVVEPVQLLANLTILDDLADLGVVRDMDVGTGFIMAAPEYMLKSRRGVVGSLLAISFLAIAGSYLARAFRTRLLGNHYGIPSSVNNQILAYFYGRGINTVLPFGPGELGNAQALERNGAEREKAHLTVFSARIFEIVGIAGFLLIALALSGWGGAIAPFLFCAILVVLLTVATRPVGNAFANPSAFRKGLWEAVNGSYFVRVLRELAEKSFGLAVGLTCLSIFALALELAGLYFLKQAFSTREFFLLSEMPLSAYMMAIGAANLTRVIPLTPGGMGLYEFVLVTVFSIYGGDYHAAITVAILDGLFTNFVMLLIFFPTLLLIRRTGPSLLETWRSFRYLSICRNAGEPIIASQLN